MEKILTIVFLSGSIGHLIFMRYFELAISPWYIGFLIPLVIGLVFFIIVRLVYGEEFSLMDIIIPFIAAGLLSMAIIFFNDVISSPTESKKILVKEKHCGGCEKIYGTKYDRVYVVVELEEMDFELKIPWENRKLIETTDSISIEIYKGLFGIRFINSWEMIID